MFSVVIPLYNKQDFIVRCVRSVLTQGFSNFELIVVDDGSRDESVARLVAVDDPRLRVVQQANAGEGAARNKGIREASREWVAFLDADDYWLPGHLKELAAIISAFPASGMVASGYLEGEEDSAAPPPRAPARIRSIDYFKEASRRVGIVWSSAVAVRRTVALDVGDFGPFRVGADLDYWARMALAAPVAISSRPTAYYFRNDQSVMNEVQLENAAAHKPLPASLADVWPSTALIERAKDLPQYAHHRRNMEAYQRNALYLTMLGRVAAGDVPGARAVSRLLPGRRLDRAALFAIGIRLPKRLIALALQVRRNARRKVRRA